MAPQLGINLWLRSICNAAEYRLNEITGLFIIVFSSFDEHELILHKNCSIANSA